MDPSLAPTTAETLPALIQRAAEQLAAASSAAEVLDAKDFAELLYDAARRATRLAKAKAAHDELLTRAARAMADALEIESRAKRRLADEYDAAQRRKEIRKAGKQPNSSRLEELPAGAGDVGLTHKEIHEARQIRNAEEADPGVVRRTLDGLLAEGEEPTRAALKRKLQPPAKPHRRQPMYEAPPRSKDKAVTKLIEAFLELEALLKEVSPADLRATLKQRQQQTLEFTIERLRDWLEKYSPRLWTVSPSQVLDRYTGGKVEPAGKA